MTMEISGWTIVWLFLLILILAVALTAWLFLFLVKGKSDNSSAQQKSPSPEEVDRTAVTKKYLDKKIADVVEKMAKNQGIDQESFDRKIANIIEKLPQNQVFDKDAFDKKIDELRKQIEAKTNAPSVNETRLDELLKILDDKDKILQKMKQHFSFHGVKECANCGYDRVPIDEDAIHCPRCGENPNIKKLIAESAT